jgi:hypothetical protein
MMAKALLARSKHRSFSFCREDSTIITRIMDLLGRSSVVKSFTLSRSH